MKQRSTVTENIPRQILVMPESVKMEKKRKFLDWKPSDNIFLNFLRESSVHGLRYLGELDTNIAGRIFWIITVLIFFGLSVWFMAGIIDKYIHNPIIVSYRPLEVELNQIPFPAITICSVNNVRLSSVQKIKEKLEKATPESPEYAKAKEAMEFVYHICDMRSSFSDAFSANISEEQLSKMSFYEDYYANESLSIFRNNSFLHESFQTCSDMILLCMWQGEKLKTEDCKGLFRHVFTDFGSCCVFNMMSEEVLRDHMSVSKGLGVNDPPELLAKWKKWNIDNDIVDQSGDNPPHHQRKAGKRSGLSLLLHPELDEYYCPSADSAGFRMTAGSPIDYPKVIEFGFAIPPNSETFVDLRPELTMADESIYDVPMEKRGCYFSNTKEYELHYYNVYSVKNCLEECIADITLENCKCVKNYMSRNHTIKLCGSKKKACCKAVMGEINQKGIQVNCSHCWPSCTQINYSYGISVQPMFDLWNVWAKDGSEAKWSNKNVSEVSVYFGSDSVYSRLRLRLYDTSALLANTGGLMGIYLGMSFVSVIELFYHFTIKLLFEQTEDGQYVVVQKWRNWRRKTNRSDDTEDTNSYPARITESKEKSHKHNFENDKIFIINRPQIRM